MQSNMSEDSAGVSGEFSIIQKFECTATQCYINEDNYGRKDITDIIQTDAHLFGWTNISNFKILDAIEENLETIWPVSERRKIDISPRALIILIFIKLKTNLPFVVIGTLFHKNRHTVSNYFYYALPIIRHALSAALYWPCTEEIRANFPICFLPFPATRIMLGSFEIKIPNLKCLSCRSNDESSGEKCSEVLKFIIGVTPAGLICFISKAYCGKTSDAIIFSKENILNEFEFEFNVDAIMVAKGFRIQQQCSEKGINLIRPNSEIVDDDFNTLISKALAYLHRSIKRVCMYNIVGQKIEGNLIPYMDDIVYTVCCMVNLSFPNKFYTQF